MAALIQLDGFYEPVPWAGPALNGLARMVFRGEVISALQQKLRYSTEEKCEATQSLEAYTQMAAVLRPHLTISIASRFLCFVAEDCPSRKIIGIVEVSMQHDKVGYPFCHPESLLAIPLNGLFLC